MILNFYVLWFKIFYLLCVTLIWGFFPSFTELSKGNINCHPQIVISTRSTIVKGNRGQRPEGLCWVNRFLSRSPLSCIIVTSLFISKTDLWFTNRPRKMISDHITIPDSTRTTVLTMSDWTTEKSYPNIKIKSYKVCHFLIPSGQRIQRFGSQSSNLLTTSPNTHMNVVTSRN